MSFEEWYAEKCRQERMMTEKQIAAAVENMKKLFAEAGIQGEKEN